MWQRLAATAKAMVHHQKTVLNQAGAEPRDATPPGWGMVFGREEDAARSLCSQVTPYLGTSP